MTDRFKQKKSSYLLELALEEQLNLDKDIRNFKVETDVEITHVFSKEHQEKMGQLFNIAARSEHGMKVKRILRQAAAVLTTLGISF